MNPPQLQLHPLLAWCAEQGLRDLEIETQGEILVVKLPPACRSQLLANSDLTQQLIQQAKGLGFSRIALEL